MKFFSAYRLEILLFLALILGGLWAAHFYYDSAYRKKEREISAGSLKKLDDLREAYRGRTKFMLYWLPTLKSERFATSDLEVLKKDIESLVNAELKTQEDFDQFDEVQTRINSRYAEAMQAVDQETKTQVNQKFQERALQFEAFDRDLLAKRRAYHERAFAQREVLQKMQNLGPLLSTNDLKPLPVFKAELELYRLKQAAPK